MNENECKEKQVKQKETLTKKEIQRIRNKYTWFVNLLPHKEEMTYANIQLRKYLSMIGPVTRSQLELISELISEEILRHRVMAKKPKDDHSFRWYIELLRRTGARIVEYKRELGIIKTEKS